MKRSILLFVALITVLQLLPAVSVGADAGASPYTLLTHWDFEGDGAQIFADKATDGSSDDTLSTLGGVTVSNGVAFVPAAGGSYISASGDSGTDLYDMADKTVLIKAKLSEIDGRNVVAGFISKIDVFGYGIRTASTTGQGGYESIAYVYKSGGNTAEASEYSTAMNEYRVFAMSFDYDENGNKVTVRQYMSTKECPSASDFVLMSSHEVASPKLKAETEFILGKRFGHLNTFKWLNVYIDDVKIFDGVLNESQLAAESSSSVADYSWSDLSYAADIPSSESYSVLNGASMHVIGDSYLEGLGVGVENAWTTLLARKYGMEYSNDAISATTLASYAGYKTNKIPMVLRYEDNLPNRDVDIVILEGGRNDRGRKIPFGTNDSTDVNTFKGAINVIINGVRERYPDALIVCITPWNAKDTTPSNVDYANAMIEVCNSRDVACINAADPAVSGVDVTSADFKSSYLISPNDVSHLNVEGMRLVLPKFEKLIAELYHAHIGDDTKNEVENDGNGTKPSTNGNSETESNAADTADTSVNASVADTEASAESEEVGGCGSYVYGGAVSIAAAASVLLTLKKRRGKRTNVTN